LLKWAGKPELNFREAASITLALENVKALIEEWAPKVAATKLGERARIPWHLCEIIEVEGVEAPPFATQDKNWHFAKWMGPVLDALRALGGSGTPKDVGHKIRETLGLPDSDITETNKSGQTKFYNEVAWARKNLVWEGLIDGTQRGIWTLTEKGKLKVLDEKEAQSIVEKWAAHHKQSADDKPEDDIGQLHEEPPRDRRSGDGYCLLVVERESDDLGF
jgi:hypothetical protein